MSFWELSGGETAKTTDKEIEIGGGNLDPIPNNSDVLAIIDEAKWDEKQSGEKFISLRWSVMSPEDYKNRKVFQKLWVQDLDPNAKDQEKAKAKRDKARRMLAVIDSNAGGKLMQTDDAPTNDSMTLHLCNKPMVIKCMVWDMATAEGGRMVGNWISAVKPKDSELSIGSEAPPKTVQAAGSGASPAATQSSVDDDEIPF